MMTDISTNWQQYHLPSLIVWTCITCSALLIHAKPWIQSERRTRYQRLLAQPCRHQSSPLLSAIIDLLCPHVRSAHHLHRLSSLMIAWIRLC